MKAKDHLEQLRIENYIKTKGHEPHKYFLSEFKVKPPRSAAQFEALIEELINLSGGKVSIITTGNRQIVNKTKITDVLGRENTITDHKFIPSTTIKGTPDLLGSLPDGRAIAVEVKFSKSDRMSKEQLKYKEAWPGVFVIAKTLDDVLEVLI